MDQRIQQEVAMIAREFGLRFVVCFGSYMTPFFRADSDIDVALLGHRALEPAEKAALLEHLIVAFRKSEMDLVDLQTADPLLRAVIARDGFVVYEEEIGLFERYAVFYTKHYYECKPLLDQEMAANRAKIWQVIQDG